MVAIEYFLCEDKWQHEKEKVFIRNNRFLRYNMLYCRLQETEKSVAMVSKVPLPFRVCYQIHTYLLRLTYGFSRPPGKAAFD